MRLPFPFQNRCLVFSRKVYYENGVVMPTCPPLLVDRGNDTARTADCDTDGHEASDDTPLSGS